MDFPSSATLGENIVDSRTEYDEYYYDDIYVGYRYFDTFNVDPAYEFGYGLSYTTFDQKIVGFSADADTVTVGVQVKNTGDTYSGKEVVEVYFSAPRTGKTISGTGSIRKDGYAGTGRKPDCYRNFQYR